MPQETVAQLLARRLRDDPGRPFVTFYGDDSGERTELSLTTYANWVAKTAGVLVDDLGLDVGDEVVVDLPTHWLGPVFLGAAWLAGLSVVPTGARPDHQPVDLVVHGPDGSTQTAPLRLGCALLPFAVAAREPLPDGAADFGTLWPGQPDAFLGVLGSAADLAWEGHDQRTLLTRAGEPGRVLTDLVPTSPEGVDLVVDTLVGGGSTVWVARPDPARWADRAAAERATRVVRG